MHLDLREMMCLLLAHQGFKSVAARDGVGREVPHWCRCSGDVGEDRPVPRGPDKHGGVSPKDVLSSIRCFGRWL